MHYPQRLVAAALVAILAFAAMPDVQAITGIPST
jgi:hypothetical protein